MRVKAGKLYTYNPVAMDVWDARTELKRGDTVKVVNLPGCPRANVMGHCHVYKDGEFAGLVCTASLTVRNEGGK